MIVRVGVDFLNVVRVRAWFHRDWGLRYKVRRHRNHHEFTSVNLVQRLFRGLGR